jgi:hypothetical protein
MFGPVVLAGSLQPDPGRLDELGFSLICRFYSAASFLLMIILARAGGSEPPTLISAALASCTRLIS